MRSIMLRVLLGLGVALAALGVVLPATAQDYPPRQYQPLLFNPSANHLVYRLAGMPWLCQPDGCKPVKFPNIADRELPQAQITALGFTERRFYLALQHPAHERGQTAAFSCGEDGCRKLEMAAGEFAGLGNFQIKQGDHFVNRMALLRRAADGGPRSHIYWCSDGGCLEQEATRETALALAPMGHSRHEDRESIWLREKAGWVMRCQQDGDGTTDRLVCERTDLTFPDLGGQMQAAAPPLPPPSPPVAAPAAPAPDNRARIERARQLIAEARRFAGVGQFVEAEQLLQDANGVMPGFPEITAARTDIARLRSDRDERLRDRAQYGAAIDQAFANWRLWEAERLIIEGEQRFPGDPMMRSYRNRLAQVRAEAAWQSRLQRAREHIATARRLIARSDFQQADRQLDLAEQLAPGLPELGQARRELVRARVDDSRDDIRELIALIDAALARGQFGEADRLLADGTRRFPAFPGWTEQRRRIADARTQDQQRDRVERARQLVVVARRAIEQGDFVAADRRLDEAAQLAPGLPEIAAARAELNRERAERQGREREIAAIAARIEGLLARQQIDNADRELDQARRRYPNEPRWTALEQRVTAARQAAEQQAVIARVRELLSQARAAIARRDAADADQAVDAAEKLAPNLPEVRQARADVDRLVREQARMPPNVPTPPDRPDRPEPPQRR